MTEVEAAISLDRAEQRWLAEARERLLARPAGAHDDTSRIEEER